MKNYNPKHTQKANNYKKDFLFEEVDSPELDDIISDVLAYSEGYEIFIDNEEVDTWF